MRRTGRRIPTRVRLGRRFFTDTASLIERDVRQHIKAGKRLDGSPQKKNSQAWQRHKAEIGVPNVPLAHGARKQTKFRAATGHTGQPARLGWVITGYHRFIGPLGREIGDGYCKVFLPRGPAPGGEPGPREVAERLNAMGYTDFFGIGPRARRGISKKAHEAIRRAIKESSRGRP